MVNWDVERIPEPIIVKYYLYSVTTAVGFYSPVLYLLFLSEGMSYTQISLFESAFMVTAILGEVPTGYVGDRIGWRNSLLVSVAVISLTILGMGLASSFAAFFVLHVMWSLGRSFKSGSDEAWLYEALQQELSADEFSRVNGRATAVTLVVGAGGALVGGYLGDINLAYPFYLAAAVNALGLLVLLTFPDSVEESDDEEEFSTFKAVPLIREKLLQPPLSSFIFHFSLFAHLVGGLTVFIQPISVDLGFDIDHMGWLYGGFSVGSAVVSYYSGEIEDRFGIERWFVMMPFVVGIAFVAVACLPTAFVAIPVFLVARAVRKVTHPLASQYINDRIDSVGRATVLSGVSMVGALVGISVKVASGALADVSSPIIAVGGLGCALLAEAILVLVWRRPAALRTAEKTQRSAD